MPRPSYQRLRETPQADADAQARGAIPRMVGNYYRAALPIAGAIGGAALGGPMGAQIGGQVGQAAGGFAGSVTDGFADEQEDPARQRALERQALLQLLRRGG
jgi:uncharacterized protein YcfJ